MFDTNRAMDALVAQPDRVFGYEPKGRGFESLLTRQEKPSCTRKAVFSFVFAKA